MGMYIETMVLDQLITFILKTMTHSLNLHVILNSFGFTLFILFLSGLLSYHSRIVNEQDFELLMIAITTDIFLMWSVMILIMAVLSIIHPTAPQLIIYLILGQLYSYINFAHENAILLVINYFLSIPLLIFSFYLKDILLIASYTLLIMPKIFTVMWKPKSPKDIIDAIPVTIDSVKAMSLIKEDQFCGGELNINNISIYTINWEIYTDPVYYPQIKNGELIKHCIFSKSQLKKFFENKEPFLLESNSEKKNSTQFKLPFIEDGHPKKLLKVPVGINDLIAQSLPSPSC